MSKFKVGDTVICTDSISSTNGGPEKGQVYKVKSVNTYSIGIECLDLSEGYSLGIKCGTVPNWGHGCFELFEENKLNSLINKANEGMNALAELSLYYFANIEFVLSGGTVRPLGSADNYKRVVRLRKKSFNPFVTSNGWEVKIVNEFLSVGCKDFGLPTFKNMLIEFVDNGMSTFTSPNGRKFRASRNGIIYDEYTLPWEDADKILKALNEMEK